jgi:hypothetical protein
VRSPGYLKAFAAPDDADDLRRHNCIFYVSAAVRGDVWTLSRKGETRLVTVSGNFRANNSEAVRDAAVRGVGLALLPTCAMWQDLKSGALVRVLPDWTPHGTFGNSLTAYYIADRQLAPKSRTLVDFPGRTFRALSRVGPRSRAGFCPKIALKARLAGHRSKPELRRSLWLSRLCTSRQTRYCMIRFGYSPEWKERNPRAKREPRRT